MSTSTRNSPPAEPRDLAEPTPIGVLPPIDGGEDNLLPARDLNQPLVVQLEQWNSWAPNAGLFDEIQLFWNSAAVGTPTRLEGPGPFSEAQRRLPIAPDNLIEGVHELGYSVKVWSEASAVDGPSIDISIDTTRPRLNQSNERLQFPDEVLQYGVTAAYLERPENQNQVVASVPLYDEGRGDPKPGDIIHWYLNSASGTGEGDQLLVDSWTVPYPVPATLEAIYPGQAFVDFGDRPGYARYRVEDRAGNLSDLSERVELDIKAAPTPRNLPWPDIELASGSTETVVLNPLDTNQGTRVTLPALADIYPGESVMVQWAEPDQFGHWQTAPGAPTDEFLIPQASIAPQIGKTINVRYLVLPGTGMEPISSRVRLLRTSVPPAQGFSGLECEDGPNLSFDRLDSRGAKLSLRSWRFIAAGQRITLEVSGAALQGEQVLVLKPLDQYLVRQEHVGVGLGVLEDIRISKAFLGQLKRHINNGISLKVFLSFDGGQSWPLVPNFNITYLTLGD